MRPIWLRPSSAIAAAATARPSWRTTCKRWATPTSPRLQGVSRAGRTKGFPRHKALDFRQKAKSDILQVEPWSSPALLRCVRAHAPVAQLDSASVFGTEGWGFESLRAYRSDLGTPENTVSPGLSSFRRFR